jgi:hypothetical protein
MEGTDLELVENYKVGEPCFKYYNKELTSVLGLCVGKKNSALNKNTHVCMDVFEGNVVPMVIHKRLRLLATDSGLSYSNFNMTTLRGRVLVVLNIVN